MDEAPELLQRWRAGDATAGDALLRGCFTSLHRFFANKVNDGVDDLIQRTLLDSATNSASMSFSSGSELLVPPGA